MGTVGFATDCASAVAGMFGTWLMSRRYAPRFWRGLLFAVFSPFLFLRGKGPRVRKFYETSVRVNDNVPESPADMALGLNLLFWAFFLQLLAWIFG